MTELWPLNAMVYDVIRHYFLYYALAGLDRFILSVIGSQLRYWCAVITRSQIKYHYCLFFIFHLVY